MTLHHEIPYAEINKPRPRETIQPRDTAPSCEAVQSTPLWQFALCGLGMSVLVALFCAGVL